jgi:hypothetical protein
MYIINIGANTTHAKAHSTSYCVLCTCKARRPAPTASVGCGIGSMEPTDVAVFLFKTVPV